MDVLICPVQRSLLNFSHDLAHLVQGTDHSVLKDAFYLLIVEFLVLLAKSVLKSDCRDQGVGRVLALEKGGAEILKIFVHLVEETERYLLTVDHPDFGVEADVDVLGVEF